ncbi:hypothetical protein THRCLA_03201 [Thraustotheca clavata]|uniref:Uncharacterized protein n=1 Tax=Thraustotheca clavata TaxID=74557 RepID=A0A1W0A2Z8_9STRA|nr:hypothetical protein THRCLA_03201 [Thraustotheca clavata]
MGALFMFPLAYLVNLPAATTYAFRLTVTLVCTIMVIALMLGPKFIRLDRTDYKTSTEKKSAVNSAASKIVNVSTQHTQPAQLNSKFHQRKHYKSNYLLVDHLIERFVKMDTWSLRQVEDEILQAEAYLQQSVVPTPAPTSKLSESRRKEILAKLNEERDALKKRPSSPKQELWDTSLNVLDTNADFPLPSSPPFDLYDQDQDEEMSESEYDDDEEMSFLKEIQGNDDTLYFASELPKPQHFPFLHQSMDNKMETHTSPLQSPQQLKFPKAVRFDIDFNDGEAEAGEKPSKIAFDSSRSANKLSRLKQRTHTSVATRSNSVVDRQTTAKQFQGPRKKAPVSHRIHELAKPRSAEYAKRDKLKMEQELASLSSCTFTPNTQTQSTPEKSAMAFVTQRISPNPKRVKVEEVTERLYVDGVLRYELRDKVKRALEDQSINATCTFKPKINRVTNSILDRDMYKPIHDRISDIQRHKKEVMRQLMTNVESNNKHTFIPKINEKSRQITQQMSQMHVTQRLAHDAEEILEKKQMIQEVLAAAQAMPFAPKLNKRSNKIVDRKPEFKLDFVSRQRILQDQKEDKLENQILLEEKIQAVEKPFQPCIGNAEKVLQHTRPKRLTESTPEQLYRMTYVEPRKREEQKKRLQEAYYNKFSFQPELNTVSKALGRSTPIQKLAQKDAAKLIRSRVVKEMELKNQAECRFRPEIAPSPDLDRSRLWNPATVLNNIELARERRRQKLEDKRHTQEYEELQRCTFQPAINRKPTNEESTSPVVVRGLNRFLELKERARRQEAEQREREAKVFNKTYTPRAYTIPQPFKLSYQDHERKAKHEKLQITFKKQFAMEMNATAWEIMEQIGREFGVQEAYMLLNVLCLMMFLYYLICVALGYKPPEKKVDLTILYSYRFSHWWLNLLLATAWVLYRFFQIKLFPLPKEKLLELLKSTPKEAEEVFGDQKLTVRVFETVIEDLEKSLLLSTYGRFQAHKQLIDSLRTRQAFMNYYIQHPELKEIKVHSPIVITGLPRTGSTLLHNLLACDPTARAPYHYEFDAGAYCDTEPPTKPLDTEHIWFQRAIHSWDSRFRLTPEHFEQIAACQFMTPETIAEDTILMEHMLPPQKYCAVVSNKARRMLLSMANKRNVYRYMQCYLQLLQSGQPDNTTTHWVLKSPIHSTNLSLLRETFPTARIIILHRDMNQVVPSAAAHLLCEVHPSLKGKALDKKHVGRIAMEMCLEKTNALLSSANKMQYPDTINLYYEEWIKDPICAIKEIYKAWQMQVSPEFESKMHEYLEKNPKGKYGEVKYSHDEFGYSKAVLDCTYGKYLAYQAQREIPTMQSPEHSDEVHAPTTA